MVLRRDVRLHVERVETCVEVAGAPLEDAHDRRIGEVIRERAQRKACRAGAMHGVAAYRVHRADEREGHRPASHEERAARIVVGATGGVDRCVDVEAHDANALGAGVVGLRFEQLERRIVHAEIEANRHVAHRLRLGRLRQTARRGGNDEIVRAVGKTFDRQLGIAHLDARQAETMRATGEQIAKRIPYVDARRREQRNAGTRNAHVHKALRDRRRYAARPASRYNRSLRTPRFRGPSGRRRGGRRSPIPNTTIATVRPVSHQRLRTPRNLASFYPSASGDSLPPRKHCRIPTHRRLRPH